MLNHSLDRTFAALADPSRRAMVERLCRGPASVTQLAEPFDVSLPAVVQHLNVLRDCGLVLSEKVGRVRTCRVNDETLSQVVRWIADRLASWEARQDRLGEYLAKHPEPDKE